MIYPSDTKLKRAYFRLGKTMAAAAVFQPLDMWELKKTCFRLERVVVFHPLGTWEPKKLCSRLKKTSAGEDKTPQTHWLEGHNYCRTY
jgi:hypothetical protein